MIGRRSRIHLDPDAQAFQGAASSIPVAFGPRGANAAVCGGCSKEDVANRCASGESCRRHSVTLVHEGAVGSCSL